MSTEIKKRVIESRKTEVIIDETRKHYIPVAKRASIIFFAIGDLAGINEMYQFSL